MPKVISVDMWGGPIGAYGFRSGTWTGTTEDGRRFKFYASIPHCDGMNEQRVIDSAQSKIDLHPDMVEWID